MKSSKYYYYFYYWCPTTTSPLRLDSSPALVTAKVAVAKIRDTP